jgi:hypothetical protein
MNKLACVLFITLALPVFEALSDHSRHEAQAFNVVAVAGHTQVGGGGESCSPCGCGGGCFCDPGERPGPCNGAPTGDGGAGVLLAVFVVGFAWRFILRR